MSTRNIVPRADGEGSIGTAAKMWGYVYAKALNIAGGILSVVSGKTLTVSKTITLTSPDDTSVITFPPGVNTLETISNKATDFSLVNNTLYPSVQAVKAYADALVVGLLDDRGNYDA